MAIQKAKGWKTLAAGHPWFGRDKSYPIPAYSEFMPSPMVGLKPMGKIDPRIFAEQDPFGWLISEVEEEYELKPGLQHIGQQIVNNIIKLGKGESENHIHGPNGQNLKNNPYWPEELASKAGKLAQERFITLLPLMLSRTQDDKGRVIWTFFGNSIHDPEPTFWKGFYTNPDTEWPGTRVTEFFSGLINQAYEKRLTTKQSLREAGFRILAVAADSSLPGWTKEFLLKEDADFSSVKYLLTFRPFSLLPAQVKKLYLSGKLALLPFPGSLVFWGMQNYIKLKQACADAGQIPLINLVGRNQGLVGMRAGQDGWFQEPRPDKQMRAINEELLKNSFSRTHRWQKLYRYQDELNQASHQVKIAKALFSTDSDALGLYDKPLARNCQIWDDDFNLLLNGPKADREKIYQAGEMIRQGGLFGYRFFYPPMKTGRHSIYWHRPLVAFLPKDADHAEILPDSLAGYMAGYHEQDVHMTAPVELWPRIQKREMYLSALRDFDNEKEDYYAHQTAKNLLSLFEYHQMEQGKPLSRSFAQAMLNMAKHKTLDRWLDELALHAEKSEPVVKMRKHLEEIIEPDRPPVWPEPITFSLTASRDFEEKWWNDIKYLSEGQYKYKDNADIITDEATRKAVDARKRDLEDVGDYFIKRYQKATADAEMNGVALYGELPFKWETDFEYALYGGWIANQTGKLYERNILLVIPGRNRKQAVVLADHYDTAYMEDVYEKESGGSGARLSANGADDNYSASATLLQAAPIFLRLAKEGKLERDVWLLHLTGEEFPADCMGARNFCRMLVEKNVVLKQEDGNRIDLSDTDVVGVYVMDMIGHNRDSDQNIFQISPGKSAASYRLAKQAHMANMIWNHLAPVWNQTPERKHLGGGNRISGSQQIPDIARHLAVYGEVRTQYDPNNSIFNTDGQIFSDVGVPVVLFMENYDINRKGYHDTNDTMKNIDLDYGAALAAIAIETVARAATLKNPA